MGAAPIRLLIDQKSQMRSGAEIIIQSFRTYGVGTVADASFDGALLPAEFTASTV